MSVRRASQRLQGLWALTMEAPPHTNGRASPPPRDVEGAFGFDGYCDPASARRAADAFEDDAARAAFQTGAEAMQPPRLQGEGPLSRIVLCFCLTLLVGAGCLAWSFFLQLAVVDSARGALADVVDSPARRDGAGAPPSSRRRRWRRRRP